MTDVTNKCASGMVYIPAGSFERGSDGFFEKNNEKPARSIYISAFCSDKHSVTNGQFSQYIANNKKLRFRNIFHRDYVPSPVGFDHPAQPKVNVRWNEADQYCKAQGKRLPTEAEREKMAKGPSGKDEFGTSTGKLKNDNGEKLAHYDEETTKTVCFYPTNGYGLCDMSGNVFEWTSDWYDEDYYQTSPAKDPKGPVSGEAKVMRGGYWLGYVTDPLRTADRSLSRPNARGYGIGFRCVSDPKIQK